ncbi:hypothetical protein DV711_06275 [Motiliproteus coralliicola]|uniref:Uncharacterized protein n=1 Tax=Motiliproteus coralliicola TaxID=2283196 RepID=A0A369WVU2_9GAMM|nr:hypothetical protein [Motiliproteus coralliicola]RDE25159.1 hypothetical protein DV711_06275 [Motiliproteus coralliicola]
MELAFVIYLISLLGDGKPFLAGGTLFFSIAIGAGVLFFFTMYYNCEQNEDLPDAMKSSIALFTDFRKYIIGWICFCVFGAIANTVIPDEDTAYKMLAAYGVTELAANEQIQGIASNSLQLIEKTIQKHIESLEGDPK